MISITDWIKEDLYPALFESIDQAFPEHNFTRSREGWKSNTYLNGEQHKDRKDKTVITKKKYWLIHENGGDTLSLVDYVMNRDSVGFPEALKRLAQIVGLQIPKNESDHETIQKNKDVYHIREVCNEYFIYCLAKAPGAEEARKYLHSRGYSLEDALAMELGYIPSQEKVFAYLVNKQGFSQELVEDAIKIKKQEKVGSTHQITIPYRSGGSIKGFKFRTITDAKPKYLNSLDLDKLGGFFNISPLKGDKDLIIMEGELDSLHSSIKGLDNVVATGGSSISTDQIKDAVKKGAKSFTLCYDTEQPETKQAQDAEKGLNAALEVILAEGLNRVYIVTLPVPAAGEAKTDPDSLIKTQGIEALKSSIAHALPYYEYWLQAILHKFGKIEEQKPEGLTPRDINNLLDEIVETAAKIPDAIDRDRYKKAFVDLEPIREYGITEEALSITVDRLTSTREKEAQSKEFNRLLAQAKILQDKGATDQALDLLDSKIKEVKLKDKATEFSGLLLPIREEELKERMIKRPDSLKSGLIIGEEEVLLPSGAISIVAAPTSHGKTTMLINLALNVAHCYPDKEAYVFSYEEDGDSILINTLNTYTNRKLSRNNRRSLKSYFAGHPEFIEPTSFTGFETKKQEFFDQLISSKRLNIHYTTYDSDTLIDAIRYLHKNTNVGIIFIDYMQLLHKKGGFKVRQEELKQICLDLKDLAVETGLPIVLGAQFNREVVNQLRIHSTKIGEAGDIERIANLILGFWNNNFEPLGTDAEKDDISKLGMNKSNTLYTKVLKYRGAEVGMWSLLNFEGNTGKITNSGELAFDSSSFSDYFN